MTRQDYERLLDSLASANVPVEQTKEKLMAFYDEVTMKKELIGKRYLYGGSWWVIKGFESTMSGEQVLIEEPKKNGKTVKVAFKKSQVV